VEAQSIERWWEEHSELDQLVSVLAGALERSSVPAASAALEDLCGAMDAHFDVEEAVYFPLLERLSPTHGASAKAAREVHARVRGDLEKIRSQLSDDELDRARNSLSELMVLFDDHEQAESRLIAELEQAASA
jgi:hypothetical protein